MNQEPNILSMLASLLQPDEAEAAAPDPWTQRYKEMQLQSQMQSRQRQLQLQAERMHQQQQQFAQRQEQTAQKNAPQDLQTIQAQLAQILQGGQNQGNDFGVPDLDIRSRNPQTGTPYFSNYRAADYENPERKADVERQYAERQGKVAAARATQPNRGSGLGEDMLAQASQLSTILNAAKVPNETISVILRATFPGIQDAKQAQTAKLVPQDKLANFYHKQTGEPATTAFADTEPDQKTLKRDYISLSSKDKEKLGAIQQLENTIAQYERMGGPGGTLDLPTEPGLFSAGKGRVGMQIDRWSGGLKAADLDSINSQITQLARAFGGDSRVSDKEMALLRGGVINDGDNQAAVKVKMDNLKSFRDTVAKLISIPGLQNKYANQETGRAASVQQASPEYKAQASSMLVKAKQQLGASATPDQIKELARKMMAQQGNR